MWLLDDIIRAAKKDTGKVLSETEVRRFVEGASLLELIFLVRWAKLINASKL